VQLAQQNNFDSISLGSSRLRSETAGLYVCQAVSLLT
jgi:16S rRNA U1498 N3-methylase RsmE